MQPTLLKYLSPVLVLAAAAWILAAPVPAQAAGPAIPGLGGPTAISVGAYWPQSDDAKDSGGSTQITADLRYHVPVNANPLNTPARTVVDVGVDAGAVHGNHDTIVPVTIGEEFGANKQSPMATGNFYVGAGFGAYILNQSGLSTATRLGGYVGAGYNITQSVFAEGKYQFVDHGDGPTLSVGMRF
jgi:hypothetical protein